MKVTTWKIILCLANSWKKGGRCIAGKELVNNRPTSWVRPVSFRTGGAISPEDKLFENGLYPRVLDVVRVPILAAKPSRYQSENYLIDHSDYWHFERRATRADLVSSIDPLEGSLWLNGFSSQKGRNDRVPDTSAKFLKRSLYLIGPCSVTIHARTSFDKRDLRASFLYKNCEYNLSVTDVRINDQFKTSVDGDYPQHDTILCISLGEILEGYAYKLVAAVIAPSRLG